MHAMSASGSNPIPNLHEQDKTDINIGKCSSSTVKHFTNLAQLALHTAAIIV
jgi:hypothetical protein